MKRFQPDVIVGTGSYVAAPVLVAAALMKKIGLLKSRIFLHEQNAVPGKLNRAMARFADSVLVAFPETLNYFRKKGEHVGYPLRRRITVVPREEAMSRLDFIIPGGRSVVFVFGGSQGSRVINRAMADALEHLVPYRDRLYIIHGVGLYKSPEYDATTDIGERLQKRYSAEQRADMESFYTWRPFFYDIQNLYSVSDLVITRGGAGSLSEISAMGLPAIIIPKAGLPGNHQVMNARAMERAGCAEVLYEGITHIGGRFAENIDGKVLADKIISLAFADARLSQMRLRNQSFHGRDALSRISAIIRDGESQKVGFFSTPPELEDSTLISNNDLCNRLQKQYDSYRTTYNPGDVVQHSEDIEYFKSRADMLLISPEWQNRNLGVKLAGLLNAREKLPILLAMLNERKRVSPLKRIFGGDFEQVGFIRRNIVTAFIRLDTLTPEIEVSLLDGLDDPYYEVRAECARAAAHFNERITARARFIASLAGILNEPDLDVGTAAAEALGKLGGENDALPALLNLWDTKYWRLRAAALKGILHLVRRGRVSDMKTTEARVSRFILTSTDFNPCFEIKDAYRKLMTSISGEKEAKLPQ